MNHTVTPVVFILVLNYNGWLDTTECLGSIQDLDYPSYRTVVIDNASTDQSVAKIRAWAAGQLGKSSAHTMPVERVECVTYDRATAQAGGLPEEERRLNALPSRSQIVIISNSVNSGYAGGNNVGIRYALARGAQYVFILNNDTVVAHDSLRLMVKMMIERPHAGCVGPKILYYDSPDTLQAAGCMFDFRSGLPFMRGWKQKNDGRWDKPYMPDYLSGAAIMCRSRVFKEIGLLDESFFMYGEDVDWAMRVKRAGWQLWYCPQSRVWHKENAASGYKSPFVEYWSTRSNLGLVRRYTRHWFPIALMFQSLRAIRRFSRGNVDGGWAVVRGMFSGVVDTARAVRLTAEERRRR